MFRDWILSGAYSNTKYVTTGSTVSSLIFNQILRAFSQDVTLSGSYQEIPSEREGFVMRSSSFTGKNKCLKQINKKPLKLKLLVAMMTIHFLPLCETSEETCWVTELYFLFFIILSEVQPHTYLIIKNVVTQRLGIYSLASHSSSLETLVHSCMGQKTQLTYLANIQ